MSESPLAGVRVAVSTGRLGAALCAEHLERLGATIVDAGAPADVELAGGVDTGVAPIVCEFEVHRLDDGALVASEGGAQATLALTGYVGPAGGDPARMGPDIGVAAAGMCGAQAMLALLAAGASGRRVRVSPLRALSALRTILWAARWRPDAWEGTHVRSRDREVDSGYRTADGFVTLDFAPSGEAEWSQFVTALGLRDGTVSRLRKRWWSSVGWGDDVDLARPVYEERLRRMTSEDAIALIRSSGGSSVPFQTVDSCLRHPQSVALGLEESLATGLPWSMRHVPGPESDPGEDAGLPLAGVRVVDFGVGGVGPFAATLLAWLGADVVKVDAPNEFILQVGPTAAGLSTTYMALNQGKRSVALDLKQADDRAAAQALVAGADVIVENFRPGAMARLGLAFEDVRALNARIVYCSATGFGSVGPLAGEPCTDPHIQAFSGFAAANAAPGDGPPRRLRYYGFLDLVTSCTIAEAITAALVLRRSRGGAVHVETSMLQAIVHAIGRDRGEAALFDDLMPTRDGTLAIACAGAGQRERLLGSLGIDDGAVPWSDVAERLATEASAAWLRPLGDAGVGCARVLTDEDAVLRRDLWELGVLRELPVDGGSALVAGGPPWRFAKAEATVPAAPRPGANTDELRASQRDFWSRAGAAPGQSAPAARAAST